MLKDYALIQNNVIVNKVIIDDEDFETINLLQAIPLPEGGDIGWVNDNGNWIDHNAQPTEPVVELTIEDIDLLLQELANENQPQP